ncbi:MAG: efflux RND transporter periplasmic adaptor subunit [Gammaproteobacteria bacterium]
MTQNTRSAPLHFRRNAAWRRGLGLLTLGFLLTACGKGQQASGGPADPASMALPVTIMEAQPQRVPLVIETVGQTEGSKEVEVQARVSGILTHQYYTEGDTVKAGAKLFSIDRAPYDYALAQARAALAQDQANLEKARRDDARLKPLVDQRAISRKEYDDAGTTIKTAQAAVQASAAKLRDAELNLSYTTVTAPITGVSGRAQHSEGSLVSAGSPTGLLTTVTVTNPIWVRFAFSETETQQLRAAGDHAIVRAILPDGSVYDTVGKLNFAGSTVDATTGTVPVRAEFANPKLVLLPGQFVRLKVTTGEQQAFLIPQSALFQGDQGKVVFTVSPQNTVAPKPVETDGWSGHDWVVTKGLQAGDKVITDNLMKLRPGAPVAPHAPQPNGGAPTDPNAKPGGAGTAQHK